MKSANQTEGKGRDFLEKIHIPYPNNDNVPEVLYRELLCRLSPRRKRNRNRILRKIQYNRKQRAYAYSRR
mgnify:CR=1 FL=1